MTGVQTCALPIFPSSEPSPIDSKEKKSVEKTSAIAIAASSIEAADTNDEERQNHSSSKHKERKNSAERYRQRNHRRKQFFGNKIVKVVELLVKYREMMSLKVR